MALMKSGECYLLIQKGATSLNVQYIIWGEPSYRDVLGIRNTHTDQPNCVCESNIDNI